MESGRNPHSTKDDSDSMSSSGEESETEKVERRVRPNLEDDSSSGDEESSEEDSDEESEDEKIYNARRSSAKQHTQQDHAAEGATKKAKTNVMKVKNIQQNTPEKASVSDKENSDAERVKKMLKNKTNAKNLPSDAKKTKKQVRILKDEAHVII